MKLVDQYPMQPAMNSACYLCGAAPRTNNEHPHGEKVIETGKYVEFEGFLFICQTCWEEGARLLGWVSVTEHAVTLAEVADLELVVNDLQGRLDMEQEANRVLANDVIGRYVPATTSPSTDNPVSARVKVTK